ncbi:hypothetical protein B0T14DRAFT_523194 [Immersiella caudata]|uniref:Ketoreductase domain-containing protein n=1 Tax=Immersiella caudata TaxID=314043 RepID=A0AA39WJE5_9PEZI|nr:hypothetical protein B0T14DRAFT_523194 [Immersiella caudata]
MFVGPSPRKDNVIESISFVTPHDDSYPAISPSNFDLAGKSVLITGASRGIGKVTALRFAMAGCSKIVLIARSPLDSVVTEVLAAAQSANRPPPTVLPLSLDVSSLSAVQSAISTVTETFNGVLDILISMAGNLTDWVPIGDSNPLEWSNTIDVNLKGLYYCVRSFFPLLLSSELKLILVTSSIGALGCSPGGSAYQMSKIASARFAEFLDQEYHTQGLLPIAIHPGNVATQIGLSLPKHLHEYLTDKPEMAGDFMVWLASERREWLAGRMVFANWDVGELEKRKDEILERDLLKFGFRLG